LYGVLKPMDPYLHLVMLTGVSKIGKLSLFSDLNNLRDISLDATFAAMLGYTRGEIERTFEAQLETVAQAQRLPREELWSHIQRWYNGYSWDGVTRLYCPFSFMVFLEQKEFKSFWYETATPTFLLHMIRSAQLDPMQFDSVRLDELTLSTTNIDNLEMASLMFQTGYLTIRSKRSSPLGIRYELGYPNEEVRRAFSQGLLVEYSRSTPGKIGGFSLELQDALINLDWTTFFAVVNRVFAGIPYEVFPKRESYAHSLMHLMLISTGFLTQSQVQTALGRMDTVVETLEHSIIFEFKIGGSPEAALEQINAQGYADGLSKPVIRVGVVFDLERKAIIDWVAR
jgi:Predicted AAA-ATPase/PD-(D/E)XK nuclease superfamily